MREGGCRVAGRATHVGEHCGRHEVVAAVAAVVPDVGEQHVARLDVAVQLDRLFIVRKQAVRQ